MKINQNQAFCPWLSFIIRGLEFLFFEFESKRERDYAEIGIEIENASIGIGDTSIVVREPIKIELHLRD